MSMQIEYSTIKVQEGQSLLDIAVQYYGKVDAVWCIVDDNNLSGIQEVLTFGQSLIIRSSCKYKDTAILAALAASGNNQIATSDRTAELSGIGFWTIGINFTIV